MEKVNYSPGLKEQLELIRKNLAKLTQEEPGKSVEQFSAEIDIVKKLLEDVQCFVA
jgi:hypothetical protein